MGAKTGLVRLVLAMYPEPVRQRYGPEIADLLAHSTRPWRDLADVGRSALGERAAAWSWARTHPQLRRVAWLVAAPPTFLLTATILAACGLMIATTYARDGEFQLSPAVLGAPIVLSVLAVCGATVAVALPRSGQHGVAAPTVTVPVSLTAGVLAIANVPVAGDLLGAAHAATVLAAAGWCAAMLPLGVAITALVRRDRVADAVTVLVLGGLSAVGLASVLYSAAAGWPRGTVVAMDPPFVSATSFQGLPALLAMCTTYALTLILAGARHRRVGARA